MSRVSSLVVLAFCCAISAQAGADTTVFFDSSQSLSPITPGVTSDTVASEGYVFTYSMDKLFTGGVGLTEPVGRFVTVAWPDGLQAQAVTSGPNPDKAKLILQRQDGDVFDITAFTFELLANTAGAGADLEIMPSLNGEDGFSDPLYFNATGYYSGVFSYGLAPNYLGQSTALLQGFDRYTFTLYVDFALLGLTVEGAPVPEPATLALLAVGLACAASRCPRK